MAAAQVREIAHGAQVDVLGNGIDASAWARPEDRPEPPDQPPLRLVSAMRLARRKRPLALIEIIAAARKRLPADVALDLTILGEGPQRRLLETAIAARGLTGSIHLPGRVDRDTLRRTHWDSHVYLSAARMEAFGIAAVEGRAAGLPVLAVQGTGVEDFITDGLDGVLAPTDATIVDALVALALDPERRRALTAYARSTPPPQDWPTALADNLAQYRRAGARG